MKSLSTSHINSMPNTNTIFFPSDLHQTCPVISGTAADTLIFETGYPSPDNLPYSKISANADLIGDLSYTIIFMIVFAFIRLRGKDLLFNLLNILIKRKKAEILFNEGISSNLICYILSLSLSFSILSGLISFVIHNNFLTSHAVYYFSAFFLYHFILLGIVHFLGWTFNARSTSHEIIANLWTYHILIGLFVSPFAISLFFVKQFAVIPLIKIVIFALGLLMIVKNIRWLEILFIHRVSILYMILYLCTLEIIPLLLLYKIVA